MQELRNCIVISGSLVTLLAILFIILKFDVTFFTLACFIFWIISTLMLVLRLCRKSLISAENKQTIRILSLICLLLPFSFVVMAFLLKYLSYFTPYTDDLFIYAAENSLGFQPSFYMGQAFQNLPYFFQFIFYFGYLMIPVIWAIIYLNLPTRFRLKFLLEITLLSFVGFILYSVMPTCGPRYTFAGWPWHLPFILSPHNITCPLAFPRNGMPSLHTAWAFCSWRYVQYIRFELKIFLSIWLFTLPITMLGIGEHYLIDIVMGLALAAIVRALCASPLKWFTTPRFWVLLINIGLFAAWFYLLRWGIKLLDVSIFAAWLCYLSTALLAILSERKLTQMQQLALQSYPIKPIKKYT